MSFRNLMASTGKTVLFDDDDEDSDGCGSHNLETVDEDEVNHVVSAALASLNVSFMNDDYDKPELPTAITTTTKATNKVELVAAAADSKKTKKKKRTKTTDNCSQTETRSSEPTKLKKGKASKKAKSSTVEAKKTKKKTKKKVVPTKDPPCGDSDDNGSEQWRKSSPDRFIVTETYTTDENIDPITTTRTKPIIKKKKASQSKPASKEVVKRSSTSSKTTKKVRSSTSPRLRLPAAAAPPLYDDNHNIVAPSDPDEADATMWLHHALSVQKKPRPEASVRTRAASVPPRTASSSSSVSSAIVAVVVKQVKKKAKKKANTAKPVVQKKKKTKKNKENTSSTTMAALPSQNDKAVTKKKAKKVKSDEKKKKKKATKKIVSSSKKSKKPSSLDSLPVRNDTAATEKTRVVESASPVASREENLDPAVMTMTWTRQRPPPSSARSLEPASILTTCCSCDGEDDSLSVATYALQSTLSLPPSVRETMSGDTSSLPNSPSRAASTMMIPAEVGKRTMDSDSKRPSMARTPDAVAPEGVAQTMTTTMTTTTTFDEVVSVPELDTEVTSDCVIQSFLVVEDEDSSHDEKGLLETEAKSTNDFGCPSPGVTAKNTQESEPVECSVTSTTDHDSNIFEATSCRDVDANSQTLMDLAGEQAEVDAAVDHDAQTETAHTPPRHPDTAKLPSPSKPRTTEDEESSTQASTLTDVFSNSPVSFVEFETDHASPNCTDGTTVKASEKSAQTKQAPPPPSKELVTMDNSKLDSVVRLLTVDFWNDDPTNVESALTQLSELCSTHTTMADTIQQHGGHCALTLLLRQWPAHAHIQAAALTVLHRAAESSLLFVDAVVALGALDLVLVALQNHNHVADVQAAGCAALLTLTVPNHCATKLVFELDGIRYIRAACVRFPQHGLIQKHALWIIQYLSYWENFRERLVCDGGLQTMIDFVETSSAVSASSNDAVLKSARSTIERLQSEKA